MNEEAEETAMQVSLQQLLAEATHQVTNGDIPINIADLQDPIARQELEQKYAANLMEEYNNPTSSRNNKRAKREQNEKDAEKKPKIDMNSTAGESAESTASQMSVDGATASTSTGGTAALLVAAEENDQSVLHIDFKAVQKQAQPSGRTVVGEVLRAAPIEARPSDMPCNFGSSAMNRFALPSSAAGNVDTVLFESIDDGVEVSVIDVSGNRVVVAQVKS